MLKTQWNKIYSIIFEDWLTAIVWRRGKEIFNLRFLISFTIFLVMVPRHPMIIGWILIVFVLNTFFMSFASGMYLVTFSIYLSSTLESHGTENSMIVVFFNNLLCTIKSGLLWGPFVGVFIGKFQMILHWSF